VPVASCLISGCGLVFVGTQMRAARRASDISVIQEFLKTATACEGALFKAETPDLKVAEFHNYLNFIEVYCLYLNKSLLSVNQKEIIREKIIDCLAIIDGDVDWREEFHKAKTSTTTFKHISEFTDQNRLDIDRTMKFIRELSY